MVEQVDHRGQRLVILRDLLGLTQTELAKSSGVGQALISQIERGNRELTPAVCQGITAGVRMPMAFFDVKTPAMSEGAVHFRRAARASARSRKMVWARFVEAHRVALTLSTTKSLPPANLSPVDTNELTRGDIDDIATRTRVELGIGTNEPVRHLMRAIERQGVAVLPLIESDTGEVEDIQHSGVSRYDLPSGFAVIGYLPTCAGDRQRLTVGHEFGHLLLHSRRNVPERTREDEAMYFASSLLYPKQAAVQDISESLNLNGYARIKAQWGVSIQALIRRGRELGLISRDRYRSLMVQLSGRGWRRSEPVAVDMERPALMWANLTDLYGSNPYMRASQQLGMAPQFLETWIPRRRGTTIDGTGARRVPGQSEVVSLDSRRARSATFRAHTGADAGSGTV